MKWGKRMGKIGICACYDNYNYGSMLQAFATQKAISKLGYENEFIVYRKKKNLQFILKSIPRALNGYFIGAKINEIKRNKEFDKHQDIKKNIKIRQQEFKKFEKNYYECFSNEYVGFEELKSGAENYSSVLVGSDQLWLPIGLGSNFYNLMFVPDNINKISYATSFGVSQIPWYQVRKTRKYLSRINYLSTRELKGREIIKKIANIDAKVVVDPTLLFDGNEWKDLIPEEKIINEKYIFCYFLGKNKKHREEVKKLAQKKNLKIVILPHLDDFVEYDENFGDYKLYDVDPTKFVNLIRNAEYICTDSFHGTVFSILNHKKFITFNRFDESSKNSRNSRIDSLCNQLNIEDRRYKQDILKIEKEIDYQSIDKKIEKLREDSYIFLKNALKNKK